MDLNPLVTLILSWTSFGGVGLLGCGRVREKDGEVVHEPHAICPSVGEMLLTDISVTTPMIMFWDLCGGELNKEISLVSTNWNKVRVAISMRYAYEAKG